MTGTHCCVANLVMVAGNHWEDFKGAGHLAGLQPDALSMEDIALIMLNLLKIYSTSEVYVVNK